MIKKLILGLLVFEILSLTLNAEDKPQKSFWDQGSIVLEQEFRLKDGDFYYEHTDFGLFYKLHKYFVPTVAYRLIMEEKKGDWEMANRIHGGWTTPFKTKYGNISLRNRIDYTFDETGNEDVRFRERFKYDLPWHFTKYEITPLIYDEIFVDLDSGHGFNRNRAGGGFEFKLTKNITGCLYYFHESKQAAPKWSQADILAWHLKFKF